MKRRKYMRIPCCILLCTLLSCTDMLDVKPKNSVTFLDALANEREIEVALGAVENGIKKDILLNSNPIQTYPELYGWVNDKNASGGGAQFLEPTNSSYIFMDWSGWYRVIARANLVIPYLDQVQMTDRRRNYYLGQVYFFKAFCYYMLLTKWGDVPYMHTAVELEAIPKTSWTIVADSAIVMAERAANLLPEADDAVHYDGTAVQHRSTPSKGSAYTLLAYLYSWKAGAKYLARPEYRDYDEQHYWQKAEIACTYVIDSCSSYQLAPSPEEVCTTVMPGDSREGIFETVMKDFWGECDYSSQRSTYFMLSKYFIRWPILHSDETGSKEFGSYMISANTVQTMYPGSDERRNAYFYEFDESGVSGNAGAYLYKWRDAIYETTPGNNYGRFININENRIWFRLADVILLRGECRARLGNDAGAIQDINRIRLRANAAAYSPSDYPGKDVRFAVFKEREKELLLEGYRWFDIIRNGYIRDLLPGGYKKATNQDLVDGCMFLGVSSAAFERNTLMRQNTYWSKKF